MSDALHLLTQDDGGIRIATLEKPIVAAAARRADWDREDCDRHRARARAMWGWLRREMSSVLPPAR